MREQLKELEKLIRAQYGSGPVKRKKPKPGAAPTAADALRDARRAARLTQKVLGSQAKVSRRSIIRWELGVGVPSGEELRRVIHVLHAANPGGAEAVAQRLGASLQAFGLAQPTPSPPAHAAPHPPALASEQIADGLLVAAAEVLDASPRVVRPALVAAFARARQMGLTVEQAETALLAPREAEKKRIARSRT